MAIEIINQHIGARGLLNKRTVAGIIDHKDERVRLTSITIHPFNGFLPVTYNHCLPDMMIQR
jgi:hypothetical protein